MRKGKRNKTERGKKRRKTETTNRDEGGGNSVEQKRTSFEGWAETDRQTDRQNLNLPFEKIFVIHVTAVVSQSAERVEV